MKLMETTTKKIGENEFYIRPFPAFVSANLSGEIAALLVPVIGALTPLASNVDTGDVQEALNGDMSQFDFTKVDLEEAGPAFGNAVSTLSGDKIETLMKKLLINHGNIAICGPATEDRVTTLNTDIANEAFCGEIQDMYLLCWEVIKLNFGGFFKSLGSRFGNPMSAIRATATKDSEN